MISDGLLDESMEPGTFKTNHEMNKRKRARQLGEYMLHLKPFFRKMHAVRITSERIKAYIVKRQNYGAASATINRELGCLKRMFCLGFEQTPQLVGCVPHIPMLKEHNIRSGVFEHEDCLALSGALPDYAQVAVSLAYYSGMRMGRSALSSGGRSPGPKGSSISGHRIRRRIPAGALSHR